MTSELSWQNSVSLCLASFFYSKTKLACYPDYLLTSYFCIPIPCDEQDGLFLVLILGVLYRTDQLQLLQHQWLGQRFGLL